MTVCTRLESGDERRGDLRLVVFGRLRRRLAADLGFAPGTRCLCRRGSVEPSPLPVLEPQIQVGRFAKRQLGTVRPSTRVVSTAHASTTPCVWPLRMRSKI